MKGALTITIGSLVASAVWGTARFAHMRWSIGLELNVGDALYYPLEEATLMVTWSVVFLFVVQGRQFRELLRQQDRARSAARDAELQHILSRIDPSRTEDALRSVVAAVESKPRHAEELLLDFSDLLRRTLRTVRLPRASLLQALDLGSALLAYEDRRLDGRLHHSVTSIGAIGDVVAPGLLLNPVLSAAVAEGSAKPIQVLVERSETRVVIVVRHGARTGSAAMKNAETDTLAQLQLLYPGSAAVDSCGEGGRTVTTIAFDPDELELAPPPNDSAREKSPPDEESATSPSVGEHRTESAGPEDRAYLLTAFVTFSVLVIREWIYYSHHEKQGPVEHFLLVYLLAFALAAFIAFFIASVVRRHARTWVDWGVAVPATLTLSVAGCFPWSWAMYRAYDVSGSFANHLSEDEVSRLLVTGSALLTTWTTLLCGQHLRHLANAAHHAILEHKSLAKDARLRALQDQTRPHFLFNALSSVVPMIEVAPDLARQMLNNIRMLFAQLLGQHEAMATLRDELSFIDRYLRCEAIRYGDYLRVDVDIPPYLEGAPIPRFLLQPLVENAMKHGMSAGSTALAISVRARSRNGYVLLEVRNTGSLATRANTGTGSGLRIVQERLASAFPRTGVLHLTEENGWVVAHVGYNPEELGLGENAPLVIRGPAVAVA
ncbi:MAG: histidine kinase [Myxococcota bacterium]